MKRLLEGIILLIGLVLTLPLLLAMAALVKFTSQGPALFRQERVGRGGKPFFILKFRTMVADAPNRGGQITFGDDPRITTVGRFFRKTKISDRKFDLSAIGLILP